MRKDKTLVLGATTNPDRYAYIATHRLLSKGYPVALLGIKKGEVAGIPIQHNQPPMDDIDTITLYVGPTRQPEYYDYLLSLNPRRIIFNPGTENRELADKARAQGVQPIEACTLVMLSTNSY